MQFNWIFVWCAEVGMKNPVAMSAFKKTHQNTKKLKSVERKTTLKLQSTIKKKTWIDFLAVTCNFQFELNINFNGAFGEAGGKGYGFNSAVFNFSLSDWKIV